MVDADTLRTIAEALKLVADLTRPGATFYVTGSDGDLRKVQFTPLQQELLQRLHQAAPANQGKAVPGVKEQRERRRLCDGVEQASGGLKPHHRYSTRSLRALLKELGKDPFFIGPFEGKASWSALPNLGKNAVQKHQEKRAREAAS